MLQASPNAWATLTSGVLLSVRPSHPWRQRAGNTAKSQPLRRQYFGKPGTRRSGHPDPSAGVGAHPIEISSPQRRSVGTARHPVTVSARTRSPRLPTIAATNDYNVSLVVVILGIGGTKEVGMTHNELDQLLSQRFDFDQSDMVAALKSLPAIKPGGAALTEEEARLLDEAGFTDDRVAFAEAAADIVAHTARLISTAYTGPEVASLLGIGESRVRQRRLAGTLWAIESDGTWLYPAIQFELNPKTGKPDKQIRGMEQVVQSLPTGMHPTAVAELLRTPQADLVIDGQPRSILDWLRSGGPVAPVLELIGIADWATT